MAVRTGLLALRVRTQRPTLAAGLPGSTLPVTSCEFPRLQLRGIAGFSPASQFQSVWTEMREPKFFKERKSVFGIYLGCGGEVNDGAHEGQAMANALF